MSHKGSSRGSLAMMETIRTAVHENVVTRKGWCWGRHPHSSSLVGRGGWSLVMLLFLLCLIAFRQSVYICPPSETTAWWGAPSGNGVLRPTATSTIVQTRAVIPLQDLTASRRKRRVGECPEGTIPVTDTLGDPRQTFANRKIPRIVHLTAKSRCLHPELVQNVNRWRLSDHSLFFHDDNAVDALLYRDWPEFPQLKYVLKCLLYGGAIKADIWRILVLWEYGGIYADLDSRPNIFNATTIASDDDAFFLVDDFDLSQWFMASSPRHPMMYFLIHNILQNLIQLNDVGSIPVIWTTGPGVIATGFDRFMGPKFDRGNRLQPGTYRGVNDRVVRLVGTPELWDEYVVRNIYYTDETLRKGQHFDDAKHDIYKSMGMGHWSMMSRDDRNETCLWRMWRSEMNDAVMWSPNW